MNARRVELGAAGERFAAWWLTQQGLTVLTRNAEVDGGEIDVLARDGAVSVVVEVRTVTGEGDPIEAIGHGKRAHVRRLAGRVAAARIDFVGVAFREGGVEIHWVPG